MERKTQLERIVEILERDGSISRNQCLSMFISRLASRIKDLEEMGYKFQPERDDGDYVYRLLERPAPKQLTLV